MAIICWRMIFRKIVRVKDLHPNCFFARIVLEYPSATYKSGWSKTGNRGCKYRKIAGEESPGFAGQDAG